MKFPTIEDAERWADNDYLQVRHDRGPDPDSESHWLQTFEDRAVGIFPTDLSPTFATADELLAWMNGNWKRVEEVLGRAFDEGWKKVQNDLAELYR